MAKPGEFYAIGFDGSGSVVLDASALNGSENLKWMNMRQGQWIDGGAVKSGKITL